MINAANNSDANRYVRSVTLNGKPWSKNWLPHDDMQKGGVLNFVMAPVPDKQRGTDEAAAPYSFSKDDVEMYNIVKDRKAAGTYNKPDTIVKNGLTLIFRDDEGTISGDYKKRLVEAYFQQYPKLIAKYNSESPKEVTFFIDPSYSGIAEAGGSTVRFNPTWFEKNPEDLDVVTHETMHLVQGYGYRGVPGWVTEGIADYVRATEGFNNAKANWSMPDLKPDHKYTSAYRVTARFFVWITQRYNKDFVRLLDEAARKKTYSDATWTALTGKTVDTLWQEYLADPVIK